MTTSSQHMTTDASTVSESSKLKNEEPQPQKKGLLSGQKPIVILIIFALALSVAFPYGLGIAVLAWVIALTGALIGVGYASFLLLKDLFSRSGSFGYAPTAAYLAGKNTKKKKNETASAPDKKDAQ
jgi:amino acid transporter